MRELATGKQLPDAIRFVKFSSIAWTKDGKGFFYGRYPEPPAGKMLEAAVRDKKIYYHTLNTAQSADRLVYERPEEPMLFIDADIDETGRYLWLVTSKASTNTNSLGSSTLRDHSKKRLPGSARVAWVKPSTRSSQRSLHSGLTGNLTTMKYAP